MREGLVRSIAMLPVVAFIYTQGSSGFIQYSPSFPTVVQCTRAIAELNEVTDFTVSTGPCIDYSKKLPVNHDVQQIPATGNWQQDRKD
jgi:hypothetical protein